MLRAHGSTTVRNAITVDVEEYYQVEAFSDLIPKNDWDKFPSRVEGATDRLLEILHKYNVHGTFFVLGCLARSHPSLVGKIFRAGHEIGSHGFDHTMIAVMTPKAFRQDIRKSKAILEDITGVPVKGYRAPTFSITERTAWAYEILLQEEYTYSSSVFPVWHDRYGWQEFGDHPRRMASNGNVDIWEVPLAVGSIGPLKIPFGGGGYLRAYPLLLTKALFRNFDRERRPGVVYIHPWELDAGQPRVHAPFIRRLRHYIGIPRMEQKLSGLLQSMKFGTVAQLLEAYRQDSSRRTETTFVEKGLKG